MPVEMAISRRINDNSNNPYGGCTARYIINSREWHSGQENYWYFYTEHGSYNANQNPYGYFVRSAGPRDLASGGYWFYMQLLQGVRYRVSISSDLNFNSNTVGNIEYGVSDPGGVRRQLLGSGVNGNNSTYNNVNADRFYNHDNPSYFADFGSEIRMPAHSGTMRLRTNTHWDSQPGIDFIGAAGEFRMSSDTGNLNLRVDGWGIFYDYLQSPIFYDLNDSGYYVNPRSRSRMSGLQLRGIDNNASGDDAILRSIP